MFLLLLAAAWQIALAAPDGTPPSVAEVPSPAADAPPSDMPVPVEAPRFRIVDAPTRGGWQVIDADGMALDSRALATALGDEASLAKLRRERTFAVVTDGVLIGAGLGLAAGGIFAITLAGPPVDIGTRPNPVDYPEYPDWRRDADAWEAKMASADARDERVWTGVTLLTGAVLAGALVPLTGQDARARATHPALLWDRANLSRALTPAVSVAPDRVRLAWVLP
ncbi:MAG: hypothetical protein V4850_37355 [Myxococcota bacterium]